MRALNKTEYREQEKRCFNLLSNAELKNKTIEYVVNCTNRGLVEEILLDLKEETGEFGG